MKPFVPTIDRKDLISEADLDEIDDDLDTEGLSVASLEDLDMHISYVVDSQDTWE